MMPDPGVPPDPVAPREPIRTMRRRPPTVSLARALMLVGAAVGLVSAAALLLAAGTVADGMRVTAARTSATPAQVDEVARVVRTALASSAALAFALALVTGVLAIGVGRGSRAARTGAFVLVGLSLCVGLSSASYTSLGQRMDWTSTLPEPGAGLERQIGQAYGDAMPGLVVGTTGGLTDLQALGYIAVAVLLLLPASRTHFRRREVAGSPVPAPPEPPP